MDNKTAYRISTVLLFLLFAYFVFLGWQEINSAQNVYNKSVELVTAQKATADKLCTTCLKDGYAGALLYFSIALGTVLLFFLLPRLRSIAFGGFNITLRDLKSDVEKLKTQTNNIQESVVDSGGKDLSEEKLQEIKKELNKAKRESQSATDPNDPQKGKWGGFSESNGRKLRAAVVPATIGGFYRVKIWVESTNTQNPLRGFVTFHLHPTFANPDPIIAVKNDIAELNLNWVYGSFTVGAEADDGKTKLELDLAQLPGITEEFKNK